MNRKDREHSDDSYLAKVLSDQNDNFWHDLNDRIVKMDGRITELSGELEKIKFALQVTDLLNKVKEVA